MATVGTKRITANARAVGASAQFIAYVIISLVVLYSDIMFISLMYDAFPGGFLTVAAIGGAFATGISVIALVIGKSHWFRPGGQLIWAWCFTALEIGISILNVVVSVMAAKHGDLGYLSVWVQFSPATPIVALVGWVITLYMDKSRQDLHEEMEMQDDLANAEREHKRQVHAARMELKQTALEQQKEYLKMHLSSADVQQALSEGSYEIARGIVSEIIQRPILPQAATKVVDSLPPVETRPAVPAPRQPSRPLKKLPPARRFVPSQQTIDKKLTEEREVANPLATGPLDPQTDKIPTIRTHQTRRRLPVRRNETQYIVNKRVPIKLND